jgi:glycosyltransferase involved in cell wall biosynthesis
MNDLSISVIIPAYNAAGTIVRALNSVLAQSLGPHEIIVIDDGSKDDLAAVLQPYADRVRLVRQQNSGASAARNHGARLAQAPLLAFLDADDFWHSQKLEIQAAAFSARPETAYCWTAGRRWRDGDADPTHDSVPKNLAAPIYVTDFAKIFARPYLGTPGIVIRRDVFESLGGFRENLTSAEDIDLWLRAAYGRTIAHVRAKLFYVVAQPHSLTATHMERTYQDNIRVIDDFCASHPDFARREGAAVKRARAKVYENWGSGTFIKGDLGSARRLLLLSLQNRMSLRALHLMAKVLLRGGWSVTDR